MTKSHRALVAPVLCALLLAACAGRPAPRATTPDLLLYEAIADHGAQSIAVVDSGTHAVVRRLPLGTPSADWRHLYSVTAGVLVDTDPNSGAIMHSVRLAGAYSLPTVTLSGLPGGLSQNGHWLVVQDHPSYAASLAASSRLLVIDTSFRVPPAPIALPGDFEFDAVSNDGQRVYLIDRLGGSSYRVRLFHVDTQSLDPQVVVDKSDPTATMSGVKLEGVFASDGAALYSVYARQNQGAFVHDLSLDAPFASCIDLAGAGYASSASALAWSLALSGDGKRLFAINAALGLVAEIDIQNATVLRAIDLPTSAGSQQSGSRSYGAGVALLSEDGATLVTSGVTGVELIDTASLHPRADLLPSWHVQSVVLSPDDESFWALDDSGQVAQIRLGGLVVQSTFDPGIGSAIALMRVAPTA